MVWIQESCIKSAKYESSGWLTFQQPEKESSVKTISGMLSPRSGKPVSWKINPLMSVFFYCFTKLAVGNKQPHVQYKRTIYRLEKTTLTWLRIVKFSNFWIKYNSCQLRINQKYNLKVKFLKIYARDSRRFLAREIKPQQRICVCLGQITIFRNFMNEDSQKRRQWAFLNETFINTCLYLFLKTKRV